ncbi:Flp family type IVb pilin [Hoeflea poritis]|uniref:Flp family type IVb pilin n=1 Tax=Hoeflea poritis TaxID=2993659 RepID=A0ABT4VP82_9HYPH|nr:Flp family type IVb pilin [Hoeflea poritis]MDA4845843.1 Flp family type IVb pilin [Hoeflea poritis]
MVELARRFLRCESGATAIEYAFIIVLISLSIIFGATEIGNGVGNSFNNLADGFDQ